MAESGEGPRRVLFLGGNGHCLARLALAQAVLARRASPFELHDVAYPGFDGRTSPCDLDGFLDGVSAEVARARRHRLTSLAYATGIGGLIALCLRARGELRQVPLLLQAPVLWGLERRLMPRLVRLGPGRRAFERAVSWKPFQARFARRCFERRLSAEERDAFFAGYSRCSVASQLFRWMGPSLLRDLEKAFELAPPARQEISVWWGERDAVLLRRELVWTERALDVRWPVRVMPGWGHYPMIDDPEGWVAAVAAFLEQA